MSGPGVPKVLYSFILQPTNAGCVMKATSRRKFTSVCSSTGRIHNSREGRAAGRQSRKLRDHIFNQRHRSREPTGYQCRAMNSQSLPSVMHFLQKASPPPLPALPTLDQKLTPESMEDISHSDYHSGKGIPGVCVCAKFLTFPGWERFDKTVSSAFCANVFEGQGEVFVLQATVVAVSSLGIWSLLNLHELPKCALKFMSTDV